MAIDILVLKNRSEFLEVSKNRKKWVTPSFILQISVRLVESSKSEIGYGITASKKMVGNAVQRNRAKRRLRSLINDILSENAVENMNYVFIARKDILTIDYKLLSNDLEKALKRMKLWRKNK